MCRLVFVLSEQEIAGAYQRFLPHGAQMPLVSGNFSFLKLAITSGCKSISCLSRVGARRTLRVPLSVAGDILAEADSPFQ